MRVWLPLPCFVLAVVSGSGVVGAQAVSPRQVVLHRKDVPGAVLIKKETHSLPSYGPCTHGYQSVFGSGMTLGSGEAYDSAAYLCPSESDAAQQFTTYAAYYEQYYHHPGWHYAAVSSVKVGQHHAAWLNRDLPGVTGTGGGVVKATTFTYVFQQGSFLAFLQVTAVGEPLRTTTRGVRRLAKIMNGRMASPSP